MFHDDESRPKVNLTLIPLGAVIIFICIFCYKSFLWAVDDFTVREDVLVNSSVF